MVSGTEAAPAPALSPAEALLRACPVCAVPTPAECCVGELEKTFPGDLERDRYQLSYCRCRSLAFISPLPSPADLDAIYLKSEQFTDALYTDPVRVKAILRYAGNSLVSILLHQRNPNTPSYGRTSLFAALHAGKVVGIVQVVCRRALAAFARLMFKMNPAALDGVAILEVGAGRAWMCRAAKELDPRVRTVAQDVSAEMAGRCDWADEFLVCDMGDARLDAKGPFDVISMTHVIEHLTDPVAALRRCADLLKKGGILFITAPHRPPNSAAVEMNIEKWRSYSYNHIPAHIQYFSQVSMEKAAALSGLKLVQWSDHHEGGQALEAWLQKT